MIYSFLKEKPTKVEKQKGNIGEKYKLFYSFNKQKDLIIIVSFQGEKLNIITVYIQNVSRR